MFLAEVIIHFLCAALRLDIEIYGQETLIVRTQNRKQIVRRDVAHRRRKIEICPVFVGLAGLLGALRKPRLDPSRSENAPQGVSH